MPSYPLLSPDRVVSTYTRIAPLHDLHALLFESKARSRVLQWADVQPGATVLEVGVGTGLLFKQLVKANPEGWTLGVDRTPAMLRRTRRRVADLPRTAYALREADLYGLDLPPAHFDVVVATYVLDLLPAHDFVDILSAWHATLRPGGRLVLAGITPGWKAVHTPWMLLPRLHPALFGGCRPVALYPYLRAAGFTDVQQTRISERTFPSEVLCGHRPT